MMEALTPQWVDSMWKSTKCCGGNRGASKDIMQPGGQAPNRPPPQPRAQAPESGCQASPEGSVDPFLALSRGGSPAAATASTTPSHGGRSTGCSEHGSNGRSERGGSDRLAEVAMRRRERRSTARSDVLRGMQQEVAQAEPSPRPSSGQPRRASVVSGVDGATGAHRVPLEAQYGDLRDLHGFAARDRLRRDAGPDDVSSDASDASLKEIFKNNAQSYKAMPGKAGRGQIRHGWSGTDGGRSSTDLEADTAIPSERDGEVPQGAASRGTVSSDLGRVDSLESEADDVANDWNEAKRKYEDTLKKFQCHVPFKAIDEANRPKNGRKDPKGTALKIKKAVDVYHGQMTQKIRNIAGAEEPEEQLRFATVDPAEVVIAGVLRYHQLCDVYGKDGADGEDRDGESPYSGRKDHTLLINKLKDITPRERPIRFD